MAHDNGDPVNAAPERRMVEAVEMAERTIQTAASAQAIQSSITKDVMEEMLVERVHSGRFESIPPEEVSSSFRSVMFISESHASRRSVDEYAHAVSAPALRLGNLHSTGPLDQSSLEFTPVASLAGSHHGALELWASHQTTLIDLRRSSSHV